MAGFLGLHLDLARIAQDNEKKIGYRKCGFLVNIGDKLTKEDKERLKEVNKEKYGLSDEFVKNLKMPPRTDVQIYDVQKIIAPKSRLSTVEKINHLIDLRSAL